MRSLVRWLWVAPALAVVSAFGGQACAQDGGADASTSGGDEIIVTAQKREQNLQDVPISMTVVSGEQIADFHSADLHSLQNSIPNLYIERLNFADTIYLRGFGTGPAVFAFDPSVSMYVDGIYSGRPQQFSSPFFDIERVEVLRGPQGALFGKNTAAGAVSIVTANPTRTFEAAATASYDVEHQGAELTGHISGPLSEQVSMRVSGRYLDTDGYVPNRVTGEDNPRRKDVLGRIAVRYEAGDVDVTAKAQYAETDGKGENQVLASLTTPGVVSEDQFTDPNPFGFENASRFSGLNGSVTANAPLGENTLTVVAGFAAFGANRANSYSRDVPAIFLNRIVEDFEQKSIEVRLTSPESGRFNYIVGAYADSSTYYVAQPFYFNLLGGILAGSTSADFNQDAQTYSLFAQGTYSVTERLRAIASLRYTEIEKSASYASNFTGFPLTGPAFMETGEFSEDHLDPSVTLQYDFTSDIMGYATYARGSKSGGFISNNRSNRAPLPLPPFAFLPEESESYEVGIKSEFADGRATVNVAIYNTTIKDLQTSVFCASCAGGGFVTKNAGSATSQGVEASLNWMPVDSLTLSLNGAYQDATYDDFLGANCLARQPASVCSVSAPVGAPNSPEFNNLAGEPLTFASKWTGNFQVRHRAKIGQSLELNSTARVAYRSRYYNSDDQSTVYGVQDGYAKVDGRLELSAIDGPWSLAVVGKNLTDERTYSFANAWPFPLTATPTALKYLDEPRAILIEAGVRY